MLSDDYCVITHISTFIVSHESSFLFVLPLMLTPISRHFLQVLNEHSRERTSHHGVS